MCGPPISQSAWIVRSRVRRSRYSSGILRKSLGSTLSLNCATARGYREPGRARRLVRRSERLHGRAHRTHVSRARREQPDDRDVQATRHLREPLARAIAAPGIAEGREHPLGHGRDQLVLALALRLQRLEHRELVRETHALEVRAIAALPRRPYEHRVLEDLL